MSVISGGNIIGGMGPLSVAEATYSFAVNGGAVGDITLTGASIPSGSIILGGLVEVTTAVTSGGSATIAIKVEGAADTLAALAVASWTTGRKSVIPAFTGATTIKTTAERSIKATVATAALTAGVFNVYLVYFTP